MSSRESQAPTPNDALPWPNLMPIGGRSAVRAIILLTCLLVSACVVGAPPPTSNAGSTGAEAGTSNGGQTPYVATVPPAPAALGFDREHPVPRCGAMESYLFVAQEFQCPGGGNPLGGDPRAGAGARRGNVGPHAHAATGGDPMLESHIVDLYEIPCPSGPAQVYVCLYHCPPGRSPMD